MASPGKTNKGIAKRFKVTGTGKLMRKRAATNHFNSRKSSSNMRKKRKRFETAGVNARTTKACIPFS